MIGAMSTGRVLVAQRTWEMTAFFPLHQGVVLCDDVRIGGAGSYVRN